MKSIIAKFHGGHPGKLANQLFFNQQLLYCNLLENTANESMSVNVEIKRVIAEIYTYVISAQVNYVKLNMKHPFLESTYLNLALFNRGMQKFGESLMMWKRLESLQKELYGPDSLSLLHTYKNIGTCYLGVGQSESARKCFRDCIDLVENAKYDHDKEEVRVKDKEELAQLNQNLYLTYVSDRDYENAILCTEKAVALLSDVYGPRSKKLASKFYQKANSKLVLGDKAKALEYIRAAIDIHENPAEDKYKPPSHQNEKEGQQLRAATGEAQKFNRIQYQNFLCSTLFMQGTDFDACITEVDKGIALCDTFEYAPLKPESVKMANEFISMRIKARARKQNTNALEIKAQDLAAQPPKQDGEI